MGFIKAYFYNNYCALLRSFSPSPVIGNNKRSCYSLPPPVPSCLLLSLTFPISYCFLREQPFLQVLACPGRSTDQPVGHSWEQTLALAIHQNLWTNSCLQDWEGHEYIPEPSLWPAEEWPMAPPTPADGEGACATNPQRWENGVREHLGRTEVLQGK